MKLLADDRNNTEGNRRLPVVVQPSFHYCDARWSDLRQEKVELVRERFRQQADSVFVLSDPKFENDHLVILRKAHLETVLKTIQDLMSGEAAVQHSMESVFRAIDLVITAIEETKTSEQNKMLTQAVVNLKCEAREVKGIMHSTIIYSNPPMNRGSIPLSQDEKTRFNDLISVEED